MSETLDVAIVGAGAAGTYLGYTLRKARPDWRIAIVERSNRVGGRLWSLPVAGLSKPIELGGMRFTSGHGLVRSIVDELRIETRAFDPEPGPELTVLRGVTGRSTGDPAGGAGYDLGDDAGRSADDLLTEAFLRIAPGFPGLDDTGWQRFRATATFGGRPLTDWAIEDALTTVMRPDAHRFLQDAFGYDPAVNNAGDEVQYLFGTGHASGSLFVPVDGMDRIPRELAARFEALGGRVELGRDVHTVAMEEGRVTLGFADGSSLRARRLVLTLPIAALEALAAASPLINGPTWRRLYRSVIGVQAIKLYCWYERPWWRDGPDAPTGLQMTTDLPLRKLFYFDESVDQPAGMLASFTDARLIAPILELSEGRSAGAPASEPLLDAVRGWLAACHPGASVPARPVGSAMQHWGTDPREVAWHYWRAGTNSDEMLDVAIQPDPDLPIHVASDAFCRAGPWVEGTLTSASALRDRILAAAAGTT